MPNKPDSAHAIVQTRNVFEQMLKLGHAVPEDSIIILSFYDKDVPRLRWNKELKANESYTANVKFAIVYNTQTHKREITHREVLTDDKGISSIRVEKGRYYFRLTENEAKTVTISSGEYATLKESDELLDALVNAGVDNWPGYDDAMEYLEASH